MKEDTVSIILTIHNQEKIIANIYRGIISNISENVQEIIIILDGCTDKTKDIILEEIRTTDLELDVAVAEAPDLNETLCNNSGLMQSRCKYSIIVQDDCLIKEPEFDKRLLKPFKIIDNVMAVSGRDAVDTRILNGKLDYYNCGGVDAGTPRNIFSIRDGVNRSPLMLDNEKVAKLGYLDEDFAPLDSDDVDLCIRGYKQFGYLSGSYVIDYESPLWWGKTRTDPKSSHVWEWSMNKNHKLILERHYEFIVGKKHSEDIIIP